MPIPRTLVDQVARFDAAVDRRFDALRGRPGVDRAMYAASELGDWSLIWHLVGTAQALRPGRRPESAVRLAVILGLESALVNGGIKSLFNRRRPVASVARPHRLRQPRTSSFPSGHASSGFTFAGVASEDDPLGPLYYGLAVLVAASRVHVKIHHASDVIAGAAVGYGLSRVARKAWPAPSRTGP
jgi:undecaprenyl-diphosphatase